MREGLFQGHLDRTRQEANAGAKNLVASSLAGRAGGAVVEHAHRDIRGNWKCTLEKLVAGDRIRVAAVLIEERAGDSVIVVTVMN